MEELQFTNSFAANLIKWRKERGLTQKQLADIVGVSASMITQYESGKFTPRMNKLEKIANALQVAPEVLLNGAEGEKILMNETTDKEYATLISEVARKKNAEKDKSDIFIIDDLLVSAGFRVGIIEKNGKEFFAFERGNESYLLTAHDLERLIDSLKRYIRFYFQELNESEDQL